MASQQTIQNHSGSLIRPRLMTEKGRTVTIPFIYTSTCADAKNHSYTPRHSKKKFQLPHHTFNSLRTIYAVNRVWTSPQICYGFLRYLNSTAQKRKQHTKKCHSQSPQECQIYYYSQREGNKNQEQTKEGQETPAKRNQTWDDAGPATQWAVAPAPFP